MVPWREKRFLPGLKDVRVDDAPGIKTNDKPKKNRTANLRCALGAPSRFLAFPVRVSHFDPRVLTSTSEKSCEEGWHSSAKGYFSTRSLRKEKAEAAVDAG